MKWSALWLGICFVCFYRGVLSGSEFGLLALGGLFLIGIMERRRYRGELERRERACARAGFWEAFCKEFASSLAKAAVALLTALVGVLLLGKTGGAEAPAAIGSSIGEMILRGLRAL